MDGLSNDDGREGTRHTTIARTTWDNMHVDEYKKTGTKAEEGGWLCVAFFALLSRAHVHDFPLRTGSSNAGLVPQLLLLL